MTVVDQRTSRVIFHKSNQKDFYPAVKKKVKAYFEKNKLSSKGTAALYAKGAFLAAIYFTSYACLLSDSFGLAGIVLLYSLIGITKGQIGFNIVHDALHGSYTANPKLNRVLGYWFDINGTSSHIWKQTHNVFHHTYTNIPGIDEDIDKAIILRLNPYDKCYWFHKYQHIYAPVLYAVISLNWVFFADFASVYKEFKQGRPLSAKELGLFFGLRALNIILFLALPLYLLTVPFWYVLLGFLSMHICAGIMISTVFQLAHLVEGVSYGNPDEEGKILNNWAAHEMMTTANFATNSRLVTELTGGLNFQIEHHLFPHVSHVHYPAISKIVKQTAKEFSLPYHENPTFFQALCSHIRMLKKLGHNQGV